MNDSLKLGMFFPSELLSITSVDHDDSSIHIKIRSKTHSSKCPECGQETETYHGTWKYLRSDRASSEGDIVRWVEAPSNKLLTTAFEASLESVAVTLQAKRGQQDNMDGY